MIPRLVVALLFGAGLAAAQAQSFTRHVNPRFGISLDVPSSWIARPMSDNGDGRVIVSPDGTAQVAMFGANIQGSAAQERARRSAPLDGETITYRHATISRVTVSGYRNGRVFYRAGVIGCVGTVWASFDLEYPADAVARYDAVVRQMNRSLAIAMPEGAAECDDQRR